MLHQILRRLNNVHRERVPELLGRARLQHEAVAVEGTPRRLAVMVTALAACQTDAQDRIRGPPAKVHGSLLFSCPLLTLPWHSLPSWRHLGGSIICHLGRTLASLNTTSA